MMSKNKISENFTVAKLLAILLVATGHYFDGTVLWVPVTIALFVFAFSSGYFTAQRHVASQSFGAFWHAKFIRLAPPLIVINLFLLALFAVEGDTTGLATPHTALALFGLSGVLDWLGIRNQSPYGNGLWFFTLLLIFYLAYPLLAHACKTRTRGIVFLCTGFVLCTAGHFYASPPHMLWPTVFGFCLGVFAGRTHWQPDAHVSIACAGVLIAVLLGLNLAGVNQFNYILITGSSMATVAVLLSTPFGFMQRQPLLVFAPCVLEIYFIHTYLFVRTTSLSAGAGYVVSIALVLGASLMLHSLAKRVERNLLVGTAMFDPVSGK